jgi:hypothetical protein
MSDIKKLHAAVIDARAALRVAESNLADALCAQHQFQVGDLIQSTKGDIARVSYLEAKWGTVFTHAVQKNKNGEFGAREVSMWRDEWENAVKVERTP